MRTAPGSWLTAIGLAFMLLGVGAGVGSESGEFGLLLGLAGVLVGANLVAVGVLVGDGNGEEPGTPIGRAVWTLWGAFTALLFRNTHAVGLILSSTAITAVAGGEAGPGLAFAMFALFLLGLYLIINNTLVLGEEE